MRLALNGWQRLWVVVSLIYAIPVGFITVTILPGGLPSEDDVYERYQIGTRYPIPSIAAMQPGTYVAGILGAPGPRVITHLGDAPRRRLVEPIC